MENHTAKHFVLQLGSLISLYLSLAFFIVLTFGFINLSFPDAIDGIWEIDQAATNIRIGFAMVVVFFPTYLVLTRLVNINRRKSKDNSYLGLTKWLIYFSLLVSGLVLLGDLVAVIMSFLEGELTNRFILKAAAVFLVIGGAFYYYLLDARGYWLKNEKQSIVYGGVAAVLITLTLVGALTQIPNPGQVREMKIDSQMVQELQDIQWRIEEYYRINETLPADLQTLYGEFPTPTAPENKPAYTYTTTSEVKYQLCATFTYPSTGVLVGHTTDRALTTPGMYGNYNWDYQAGEWCFDRLVETTKAP